MVIAVITGNSMFQDIAWDGVLGSVQAPAPDGMHL